MAASDAASALPKLIGWCAVPSRGRADFESVGAARFTLPVRYAETNV